MNRVAITSAAMLLLGGVGMAKASPQQAVSQNQNQGNDYGSEIIIVHGSPNAQQLGDLALETPQQMQQDSVYLDGQPVGQASDISDFEVRPGTHHLKLCAPDGTTDYQRDVGVAAGQVTYIAPRSSQKRDSQNSSEYNSNEYNRDENSSQRRAAASSKAPLPESPAAEPGTPNNDQSAYNDQTENTNQEARDGKLKLNTPSKLKNDAVFVDGNYAGIAKDVKDVHLSPGTHNIALCGPKGKTDYQGDVNISANKTTSIKSVMNG